MRGPARPGLDHDGRRPPQPDQLLPDDPDVRDHRAGAPVVVRPDVPDADRAHPLRHHRADHPPDPPGGALARHVRHLADHRARPDPRARRAAPAGTHVLTARPTDEEGKTSMGRIFELLSIAGALILALLVL